MLGFLKKLFGGKGTQNEKRRCEEQGVQSRTVEPEYPCPLKLRVMGCGSKVNYEPGGLYACDCLWWVSEETDENGSPVYIRESEEHTVKYPANLPFKAAGKRYLNIGQLYGGDVTDGMTTDVHGRQVLCYRERFPCFDSFDYLYEHRYYRWFILKENGRLTRVYTADESGWVHVTEDVENLECDLTAELKTVGWTE